MIVSIAVAAACKTCDMENQRLKAHQAGVVTEPKAKLRRGEQGGSARCAGRQWAVSEGVAIAAGEPEMEINPEVAEEVDVEAADERVLALGEEEACTAWLRPGCASGDSSMHGGAAGAFHGCFVCEAFSIERETCSHFVVVSDTTKNVDAEPLYIQSDSRQTGKPLNVHASGTYVRLQRIAAFGAFELLRSSERGRNGAESFSAAGKSRWLPWRSLDAPEASGT